MGAQVDLFCKFTRKAEIGVEDVCVGGGSGQVFWELGPYFAPDPDEVGGGASKGSYID